MSAGNKSNNTHNDEGVVEKTDYEKNLEEQVSDLKKALEKSKTGGLSNEDLARISNQEQEFIYKNQESKKSTVDQIYKKKGFIFYWTVKLPVKILNIGSILDNQKVINDNLRALSSPICPVCEKGILMYDLKKNPVNGQVLWFCGNSKKCDYSIWAEPSAIGMLNNDLSQKIAGIDRHKNWTNKWLKLSEKEKQELIEGHLLTAIIYRNMSFVFALILVAEIFFKWWWCFGFTLGALIVIVLLSLKWGYFAWRIKTGDGGFLYWVRNSKAFYNVDWVNERSE